MDACRRDPADLAARAKSEKYSKILSKACLLYTSHRRDLRKGDLVFPEEILPIGHMLDVQIDCVGKEVQQEVFGPELDPSPLCDWLNLHTAYDFALQDVVDHIELGYLHCL